MTIQAAPLPAGFGIRLDAGTKELTDGSLFGGSPARVLKLTAAGHAVLAELRAGPARSAAARQLARRLTDAGLAHPVPPAATSAGDITVIIPVRDRAAMLDCCLRAVSGRYPVLVVDDGSSDPAAIAAVAARHGAAVCRRQAGGGPAAARNAGLRSITPASAVPEGAVSEGAAPGGAASGSAQGGAASGDAASGLVAFLDSDCEPPSDWIDTLAAHFADPLVAAVAPRIVPRAGRSAAGRYSAACSSLDLGPEPATVRPGSRVSYVPTAALLVRRCALPDPAFDEALRYGEDVDLVWRMHEAGWRVRYEPAVCVRHAEPGRWPALLARRFRYGTSAAPLARRHPASLAPLVLQPWPALTASALLARKPVPAAAALFAGWLSIASAVRRAGVPADGAPAAAVTAVHQTWLGIGRYATQFASPALVGVLAWPGRQTGSTTGRRRWGRRAAAASLLLGPAVTRYRERRPDLDPVRFTLACIADDICYGAGVWAGCARQRTLLPVRPAISMRLFSQGKAEGDG